jgi:hypothetical protein
MNLLSVRAKVERPRHLIGASADLMKPSSRKPVIQSLSWFHRFPMSYQCLSWVIHDLIGLPRHVRNSP